LQHGKKLELIADDKPKKKKQRNKALKKGENEAE
jgi:hypothetical protein